MTTASEHSDPIDCQRCGRPHPRCSGHNTSGGPCMRWPRKGIRVCPRHGGRAPQVIKAAEKREQERQARTAVTTLGLPEDIDPSQALLDEVQRTAGHVKWLANVVAGLEKDDLVWGKTDMISTPEGVTTKFKAAPNVWYQLYQAERMHLARVCSAAIAAGVSERLVKVYERVGAVFVEALEGVLSDLDLTEQQRAQVPSAVVRHLQALTGGE